MSGGYLQFQAPQLRILPIVEAPAKQQQEIASQVQSLTKFTSKLYHERKYATDILKEQLKLERVSERLKTLDNLGWNEFIEELEKLRISLPLSEKEEFHGWFRKRVEELGQVKKVIRQLNHRIDTVVYDVYGLTTEERELIEAGK
jgi:hypothetical protein